MIEIVKKSEKKKKKADPYYLLKYNYMIGDADGNTNEEVYVNADNPFLEKYLKIIDKLKPVKGRWGIMFEYDRMKQHMEEGQITQDEYDFLMKTMFEDGELTDEEQDFVWELSEGIMGQTEYSFLTFEGYKLTYVDEYGVKHKTKIK